jgi:3-hydroxyacyl-[acyl-carrier-protein] dehydratase
MAHRRPFLMVDQVDDFQWKPRPALHASRSISLNEPVFDGHFPDLPLWPGAYTLEGLGQSCNLLLVLDGALHRAEEHGRRPEEILEALRMLDLAIRLQQPMKPEATELLSSLSKGRAELIGFTAAVDVKFTHPVFAGQKLEYTAVLEHRVGDMARLAVEAVCEGRSVAHGTLTSATNVVPALVAPLVK